VLNGMDMQQAFDLVKVIPDLKITKSDSILFIHRKLADGSIYFVSNQKNTTVNIATAFRITGKTPELWNAINGSMRPLPAFTQTASATSIPMQLAPYESAFVVFRKDGNSGDTTLSNYPSPIKTIELTQPWVVNFDKAMRGPAQPVVFNMLTDWSENVNDSIKYYSGTAYYHTTFKAGKLIKGAHYIIDLGVARAIAKVTVNGIEMGGAWTPPYTIDITGALKKGENKLEIKVVNTWVNRLVGDSMLPKNQRPTSVIYGPDPGKGLESSGLLGPVKIDIINY